MAEQLRRYEADVRWLVAHRDRFVDEPCPACGSAEASPKWRKYDLDYVECGNCETTYMRPRPEPALLGEYYRRSENYAYWSEVVFPASEDARREKIFRPRAERVVEIARHHRSSLGTLVDVGAGFGTFCEEVERLGAFDRVIAIEPEPHLAAVCRERGLEVIESPVEDADLGEELGVITSFEVIEHLFAPRELIGRCSEVLAPGGLFIVTCPNGQGFDVVELGAASSVVDTEHLNYFHPASLARLVDNEGLEVLETRTPGRLDAEIVRKRALAGDIDLAGRPFLKRVLIDEWDRLGDRFQDFLAENGLSSNMWVVARQPGT